MSEDLKTLRAKGRRNDRIKDALGALALIIIVSAFTAWMIHVFLTDTL